MKKKEEKKEEKEEEGEKNEEEKNEEKKEEESEKEKPPEIMEGIIPDKNTAFKLFKYESQFSKETEKKNER